MLDIEVTNPSKFRTKTLGEINDDACWTYNTNSQIKFKTITLKSSLCDYSDVYILVKWTIIVVGPGADVAAIAADRNNYQVIFQICVPFTDCNNTQVGNAKDLDIVVRIWQ